MGQIHRRSGTLPAVSLLGEIVVGTARRAIHFRCLYHEENPLAVVERRRRPHALPDVVGRCTRVRPRRRLFHQPILLPELRHPLVVAGKIAAHGRLSLRVESQLRTAHPANAADNAAHATHAAAHRHEIVYFLATLGLSPCEGTRTGRTERHRGVQLPCRRLDSDGNSLPNGVLSLGL